MNRDFKRHDKWIHQLADKTHTKLSYD